MLTSRFGFGYGMGYSAYKEATALIALGHSVTVVHCYSSPEIAHFFSPHITLIHLPMKHTPLVGFFLYIFKLRKFFQEKLHLKDFDCVYIQSLEFGLLNLAKIKVPIFYFARSTMHGMRRALRKEGEKMSPFAKIIHGVVITLERRCMRYSKMIFVKSNNMVREVSILYNVPLNKIAVITGGIDQKDFQIQPQTFYETFRRKFKIPLDVSLVLYAGRIVPQKGLSHLIEASLALLREIPFVVVIAGADANASYCAKIKRQVENSAYKKSFYFLGHVHQREMSLVLNAADCLVTPSIYEPFGMVNLQAAFLSKNIITTDATGSADLLADYEKIKIVHAGSSAAIELAMREVLFGETKKSQTPFDFRKYSWLNVAEQLIRYFQSPSPWGGER